MGRFVASFKQIMWGLDHHWKYCIQITFSPRLPIDLCFTLVFFHFIFSPVAAIWGFTCDERNLFHFDVLSHFLQFRLYISFFGLQIFALLCRAIAHAVCFTCTTFNKVTPYLISINQFLLEYSGLSTTRMNGIAHFISFPIPSTTLTRLFNEDFLIPLVLFRCSLSTSVAMYADGSLATIPLYIRTMTRQ